MKKILYSFFLASIIALMMTSCEDLQVTNTDLNNPDEVPSNMLMSGTEKKIMDYIYDNWFSGRQCLVYSQYWGQRNYTEEDRYQIRESVNNSYFNVLYTLVANLNKVIELNTDESTATISATYGANVNQIAAARILKAWLYSVMTDTWGGIPYSEAGQLTEDVYYPKYDDQEEIYADLINELTEASAMIDESEEAFTSGDMIFSGDASKWKKFANSLKCRLAIHISKVDSNWKTYIAEALASGVFESNDDNAAYHYTSTAPEYCMFYSGFFVSARNDFSMTRPFMDILKGQADTLNVKSHPWEGVVDPRLEIYTTPRNSAYIGVPYGIPSGSMNSTYRNLAPNWYANPPLMLNMDFPVPMMTYAELQFILCEYNDFSSTEYEEGVRASLEYWNDINGTSISTTDEDTYVAAVSENINAETVALQKYIDLYMNGTEAWTELRRTGYPEQILRPNEISCVDASGESILFTTLSETNDDIIARVKYPTNESTLNGDNFVAAVAKLTDGTNNYYSKMFWDVRTSTYDHPANK
jgi:hypothetical protein